MTTAQRRTINGVAIGEQPKWTWLREELTGDDKKDIDPITGWKRTPFETYRNVIFPEVDDWIHDRTCPGTRYRPDFRSEQLKIIIEFDGILHYKNPENIIRDRKKDAQYRALGYEVVRIPYFIQLTNQAVKQLFHRDVSEELFNPLLPSLFPELRNTPAFLCPLGIQRMAKEFRAFPEQYKVNAEFLQNEEPQELTGVKMLRYFYEHPEMERDASEATGSAV